MSNILQSMQVKDFVEENKDFQLITVDETDTVAKTMKLLANNRIMSVPVFSESEGSFVGMVDMLDLVTFCTAKFSNVEYLAPYSYQQMEEFASAKVGNLTGISGRNKWWSIRHDASASDLLKMLSQKDCHRVAVINQVRDVVGLITQWALVKSLYDKRKELWEVFQKKVEFHKGVETIEANQFVIEAFKRIWDKEVSGLAVVDKHDKLLGNISATDLQRARVDPPGELIQDLYQPIKQFLKIRCSIFIYRSDIDRETTQDKVLFQEYPNPEPLVVGEGATVEEVVKKIVEYHVHRIYVVDSNFKPVGVVSLGDILSQFLGETLAAA